MSGFQKDIFNTSRPQGSAWDIGAYEYAGTPPPPPPPVVATPTITPAGGSFSGSVTVSLACATSGATIHYTTNGNPPTASSPSYLGPFTLLSTTTVQALATAPGMTDSALASATLTVTPLPPTDTTPPITAITAPLSGASVARRTTLTITATASDNVGVVKVELSVNGTLTSTDLTAPYAFTWKVPGAKGKSYTLQTKASDAAGNVGNSSLVTVRAQ